MNKIRSEIMENPWTGEMEVVDPITTTVVEDEVDDGSDTPCEVIVYNDELHSVGEVVDQIKKATGDSDAVAFEKTMTIHEEGSCIVYEGNKPKCVEVKDVLEEIQLDVEIKES